MVLSPKAAARVMDEATKPPATTRKPGDVDVDVLRALTDDFRSDAEGEHVSC
jgi:hypothetical protein